MKFGKPLSIDAQVTILCTGDKVEMWVEDKDSHNQFLELEMSAEAFTAALGRLAARPAKAIVRGLDKIGTAQEIKTWEFQVTDITYDSFYHERLGLAEAIAKQDCPEGWEPDMGFNSQNSFFRKGEEEWARTTIRRWVPKPPVAEPEQNTRHDGG